MKSREPQAKSVSKELKTTELIYQYEQLSRYSDELHSRQLGYHFKEKQGFNLLYSFQAHVPWVKAVEA
jgi:hypothetical protein